MITRESKTLSDYPKRIAINPTMAQLALGLGVGQYVVELTSMRTLKKRIEHEVKPVLLGNGLYVVSAPSGYRITRLWRDRLSIETELTID